MKFLINLSVILLFFAGVTISYPLYLGKVSSPCDKVRTYSIGSVDPKFGYSMEKFIDASREASEVWNEEYGKELLAYNADAELSVNLVYDERQSLFSKIQNLEGDITRDKEFVNKEAEAFDARVVEFEKKVSELNAKIGYWNSQGGAPQEEYERLRGEQGVLSQEAARLNEDAKKFNRQVGSYNAEVKNLNKQIANFNDVLHDKPEGGVYLAKEDKIEIYIAGDRSELVRILAHEMGHALGIGHVSNPDSIMFPLSSTAQKLSADDLLVLSAVCKGEKNWKIISTRFQNNLQFLFSKYATN